MGNKPAPEKNNLQEVVNQEGYVVLQPDHEQPEEEVTRLDLAELLEVGSDSKMAVDGVGCFVCSETNSGQQTQEHSDLCLIQISVSRHFPEPPEDLEQNLLQHLDNVKNTLINEFQRLVPKLDEHLMAQVMDRYHCHTFTHLDGLLQNISSSKNHFLLMNWVLKTYLSHKLLAHPDLQPTDPLNNVDLLLCTEWEAKARDKLLQSVQKEVRGSLENILQIERTSERSDSEEHYVRVFVDTIQCITANHQTAQQVSTKLSDYVQEVCFQELLTFVKRYTNEQREALTKKTTMDQPETIHFLKTLKTCKELRQFAQVSGAGTESTVEIVQTLDNLEAFTLKLLMDIVTNFTEMDLKVYFKSNCKFLTLFVTVRKHFPKLGYGQEEQKKVMDEAYKLIVELYVKHLIQNSRGKLEKFWSDNVGKTVREDAELLHKTVSKLAPGIQQESGILLQINELLKCTCNEALKITAVTTKLDCHLVREDPKLLPALLKWQGLPRSQVSEVMGSVNALP